MYRNHLPKKKQKDQIRIQITYQKSEMENRIRIAIKLKVRSGSPTNESPPALLQNEKSDLDAHPNGFGKLDLHQEHCVFKNTDVQ
jgi:hypothetical protein